MHDEERYTLVLANGAFKSGSTWLRDIAKRLVNFDQLPDKYSIERLKHWVIPTLIPKLMEDETLKGPFLSKSHIYKPKIIQQIIKFPRIRVLNIERNLLDVLVSAYYHFRRQQKINIKFKQWFWVYGRFKAIEIVRYTQNWALNDNKIFKTKYELLINDFAQEIYKIADFLEIQVSEAIVQKLKEDTSIENLRKEQGEENLPMEKRFFRKGIVGDWESHFDEKCFKHTENILSGNIGKLDMVFYYLLIKIRRKY